MGTPVTIYTITNGYLMTIKAVETPQQYRVAGDDRWHRTEIIRKNDTRYSKDPVALIDLELGHLQNLIVRNQEAIQRYQDYRERLVATRAGLLVVEGADGAA